MLATAPLLLLGHAQPTDDLTLAHKVIETALTTPKTQAFPDYSENYRKTVVVPQLEAAQATEIARQAELALSAQAQSYTPQNAPNPITVGLSGARNNIYMHESGNNPKAQNSSGCLGLGQACPGSKLLAICPDLDYGCEDQFFTSYALSRYGSWDAAWSFWQGHSWW